MAVQINVAANQAALVASIQAGVQAYNQRFANNNQINLNINSRAFSQPLGRITGDVKDFEAALAASNARVIAFGASTAVLGGVIRSFKELATVTIDVEKNLADINRVFGLTTSQLQKFSTDLFNVSKQTASSFDEASKAALEFSRQGLKAEDTLQRTKDALTLTRLAGISTANAVDALTSTVNGFAATGISTTQILNKLVAVEQDYAVGAGDLAEALSRTGQAAQEAGVSLDQLNALVTAAQQSTARGGAVIGNALKTIFTRLQRTETLDQLEAFNIAVRDVQGNILPAVTILQNFAGAYKNLADAQKAQLSEQVAGVYQVNILKAVVNDLNNAQGVYAGALQRGASATNEAEVATAKLNRTLDALLSQTATSAQQLANNIGKVTFEPLARYGTEQLKSLVENMNEILEGEGIGSTFANGLLKGIRNILAGPGAIAAFFTLFKLIQNSFTYLSQALPQIAGITTETQNRKNIEQSILQIMQQQGPLSQALAGTMGNQAAQAQLLLQLARQQTAEYQQQSALAKQLAVQLSGQGVKVAGARGLQVTRAGGYVPPATRMAEVVGAQAGGYSPGKVVASPVGGVMNTAEDVKYIPGFAQPFINPPANSKAGRAHRQNAINRTGVDPYVANGFIPNFAPTKQFIDDKGEAITGKKPNKTQDSYTVRLTNYNPKYLEADEDLDLKRKLVDSGYWNDSVRDPKTGKILHYSGERNNIYDTLSGNLKVVKYLNKDEVDKATKIAWDGLISGNTAWIQDPNITKLGMDQSSVEAAFDRTKGKLGLTLEDFRFKKLASKNSSIAASNEKYRSLKTKTVYKTPQEFEKSLNGDFSNFIGDFYEQLVLKHQNISGAYQISAGNTDPADLVPKILGQTMYKGIEAKNTAARINDLIAKAIRINVDQMNQNTWDKSNDVDFGTFPIYQTQGVTISHNGFIPNFSPLIDDNARNKHDFPGGVAMLPIPDKAVQNIIDRQKKRQMTFLDFDRTLVRTMGDIAYSRVSPDKRQGVLNKMFEKQEARLSDIKNSKLTQFGELLRQKINAGLIDPDLLGIMTASGKVEGMPEFISNVWKIPKANQVFRALPGTKEARLADLGVSASGFIPNFAVPTSAMRIPWFKKFANPAYDNIQPTLGISKASDVDTFRQTQFKSTAKNADKQGDPNIFGPLYEDFGRKALQLVNQSNIFGELVRGSVLQSKAISDQTAFDNAFKLVNETIAMDFKGFPKNNLSGGSIAKHMTDKYNRVLKTDPEQAAKIKEAIMIFNEPGHENQLPSEFGKNFIQLAATSYSQMLKNTPNFVKELSNETNMLLNRYVKNPAFLAMSAANGFIPNFASRREMFRDLIKFNLDSAPNNQNILGGKTTLFRGVRNNKNSIFGQSRNYSQTENSRDYFRNTDIDKIANDHISEKKLLPFVSASTDKDIAEYFARGRRDDNLLGSGAVGSKTIKNSRIFSEQSIRKFIDKYGEKALKDLMLELSNWGSFGSGKGMAINFQSFSQKKGFEGTDFAKEISFLSNGFIPNFGNLDVGARSMLINSGIIPFVVDLQRKTMAASSAADDMFHSQIVNKKFLDPKTKKPIYPKLYGDDIHSAAWKDIFVRGFVDSSTGKVNFDLTAPQKEDKNFMQKYSTLLEQVKAKYAEKFKSAIPMKPKRVSPLAAFRSNGFIPNFANFIDVDTLGKNSVHYSGDLMKLIKDIEASIGRNLSAGELRFLSNPKTDLSKLNDPKILNKFINSERKGGFAQFVNGFIPNFNFIKGRNSFQKNWLIETAKKRNLNLNDPNVFNQLATEFAKTYPNDQGMFGFSKGFIPNFANKSIADHKSIRAIYDLFIGGKKINEKNDTLDELLKIADPNNNQFKQLKTKGTRWTVQDIKGLPISEGIYANGFIPNFAYKQAVMGLEESMSGNKAIFDTKPFPHIRNSSQPTFSSAIADHGGLNNALNDSMRGQKAAGLMNKGFIPNFVKYGPSYSYMPSSVPSGAPSGSSIYYPSGNPNKPQAVSPTYQPTNAATNPAFNGIDVDKAIENFIKRVQSADDKLGFFERAVGGRSKLIDSEMIKLKDSLYKGGLSGQKLDEAMNRASKEINQQESRFSKSLSSASTAISLAGPMIAGFAEEIVFGNKKRTDMTSVERGLQSGLSTGFTAISTGAGIGASFGPFGAAIGGAAGALVGLTSALNATKLTAEELAQLNQEQVQKSQASISAASSYIEAQKSLTQMISAGASSSDIEIASKKLSDNFNEIKDTKLQEIFNATGGDVTEMTKQLQEYTNQVTKESAIKTGLFGENINVQERGSALAMGLGKDRIPAFIEELKKGVLNAQEAAANFNDEVGFGQKQFAENRVRKEAFLPIAKNILKERGFQETDKDYESQLDRLLEVLNKNAEGLIISLEKSGISSEVNKAAINFKQAATKSFNQIFLDIEQQIAKSAFDVALSFEKDSGSRRIQSAILDFSTNFQDSVNSFLSNNLPDARKFDFAAATAGQKAQLQLLKSQQDYDKALAEQANDRSIFLSKNAENLSKEFKSSFLPSQASAEFFQKNILPQIQQGTFTGNAASLADQFKTANLQEAKNKVSKAGFADFFNQNDIESTLKNINTAMDDLANNNEINTEKYKKLQEAQQALIDLQNQTALFQNKNEMTKLQGVIDTAMREKEIFEAKQQNAKKELEINKQLSEARIAAEKNMAVEKAKVDKENFMRMESMKNMSSDIANFTEIQKARSSAAVNELKRSLQDPRQVSGLGIRERNERRYTIEDKILQKERAAEDMTINAEIQQRMLELAAQRENTTALYNLTQVIDRFAADNLLKDLGGQSVFDEMQNNPYIGKNIAFERANLGADALPEQKQFLDQAEKYTSEQLGKFEAYKRIQASLAASKSGNTSTATVDAFAERMSKANFNKMNIDEQMTFLSDERKKADEAGEIALSNTIQRFQDQIKARKTALGITRKDIDAQMELNRTLDKVNLSFIKRFKLGYGELKYQGQEILLKLGEDLPKMFADGIVNGIKAAIRETDNLGEALMGIAGNFLDAISTAMMQASVYSLLGGMNIPGFSMGKPATPAPTASTGYGYRFAQKGGVIRAQNGVYVSGTGSGDKYPAMLENGEYVLNRNAVMAMGGPAELDKLNFSMAPRFATGGAFATELTDLKSMEEGMTTFGLENSKLYNELRDVEKEKQAEKRRKAFERKKMIASIIGSIASIAVSAGAMKVMSSGATKPGLDPLDAKTSIAQKGGSIGNRLSDVIPAYAEGGLHSLPIIRKYSAGMQGGGMYSGVSNNSNTVNNNNASNSFNFNTTVNRDGTIEMGANTTSYKQQDVELSNNLNSKIYGTVLDVIKQQQRFGGTLAGTRRPI